MNRYLKGQPGPLVAVEPDLVTEEPQQLKMLGERPPDLQGLETVPAYYRNRFMFRLPDLTRRKAWVNYLDGLRADLCSLLGEVPFSTQIPAQTRGPVEVQDLSGIKLCLQTEPGVTVPAWLFQPPTRNRQAPAVVIVHPEGKRRLLELRAPLVRACLARGWLVLALDPRLRGELQRCWFWNEVIWGRPEEGMAAHDLNAARQFLAARPDVNPGQLLVMGLGDLGRAALHAAALDPQWAGVAIDDVGPLYAGMNVTNVLPNVLRYGDLPQFAALAAPRALWLNGAKERFGFTAHAYAALSQTSRLTLTDLSTEAFDAQLPHWLSRIASQAKPTQRPAKPSAKNPQDPHL